MDLMTAWRIFNFVLAAIALLYLALDLRLVRDILTERRLYLTFALMGLLWSVVVGSMESILQDNPVGFRTAFVTAACIWCIYAMHVGRDERQKSTKNRKKKP